MHDVLLAGGGAIGLAAAWELAGRGYRVAVADRGAFGQESSWAGAGIVSPAPPLDAPTPFGRLRAASYARWPSLAAELAAATGIDVGYRECGGLHLLPPAELPEFLALAAAEGIAVAPRRAADLAPAIAAGPMTAVEVPGVRQVRNPRMLRALVAALTVRGAAMLAHTTIAELEPQPHGWLARTESGGTIAAHSVVVCAGAWTDRLLAPLGVAAPVRPVRGQLLALRTPAGLLRHVVEVGKRYVVPRDDGVTLVGATEEAAGYDKTARPDVAAALREFAAGIVPALAEAPEIGSWTGLRPATPHGRPWLFSPRPGLWVAAGHYRQGLQLAPGTALLLANWLSEQPTFARPEDFAPGAAPPAERSAFVS